MRINIPYVSLIALVVMTGPAAFAQQSKPADLAPASTHTPSDLVVRYAPASSKEMPTQSSGASHPGATTNTDKEVPANGVAADKNMGSTAPSTSGQATGQVEGSNPNPATNKNPDPEVPGKKQ